MRKILICLAAILSALALGALAGAWSPLSAQATSGGANNGEFIVRCPMTGEVQAYDPILAPGGTSEHTHMFFGHYNVKPTSTAIAESGSRQQRDNLRGRQRHGRLLGSRELPERPGIPARMCATGS